MVNFDKSNKIFILSQGLGYAKSTKEELEFIKKVFKKSGLLLDPVYTGKTVYTLFNLISQIEPTFEYRTDETARQFLTQLKGNRILFIHDWIEFSIGK